MDTREDTVASKLNPYVSFDGNAREALEFYKGVFGGDLNVNTFGDFGNEAGGDSDKIMHGQLETDAGFTLMAADNPPGQDYTPGNNHAISLSGDDDEMLRSNWQQLSDGGNVMVPLEKQMWGDEFGMCADKFGVTWMVNIAGQG
jgi:PhnB protein